MSRDERAAGRDFGLVTKRARQPYCDGAPAKVMVTGIDTER